jgi:hypothetical protein
MILPAVIFENVVCYLTPLASFALISVCSFFHLLDPFVARHLSQSWRTFCIFNGLDLNEEKALSNALCIGENTLAGGNVAAFFNGSLIKAADFDFYLRKSDLAATVEALRTNFLLIIPESHCEVIL